MYSMNRWGCHGGQPGIGVSRLVGIDFGVWNTFWWPWLCLDGLSSQTQGGSGWCCWLALIVGTSRRMYWSTSITAHLLFRAFSKSIPLIDMVITGSVDSLPSNWLKESQGVHCIICSLTCCQRAAEYMHTVGLSTLGSPDGPYSCFRGTLLWWR